MNAERLHTIALAIRDDLKRTAISSTFDQLVSALSSQVSQPAQPQYQQQVSERLQTLSESLSSSATNSFSPTWEQTLEELGAAGLLGNALRRRVTDVFARNQITPSVAHQELSALNAELQTFTTALDQLLNAFAQLGIASEKLAAGECEVGVLVPRGFVDNRLDGLGAERSELDRILEVFSEVAIGTRPGFAVRTISSTDFSVFFDTVPRVAACIAVAIERIVALYKQLLEIRKLKGELAAQGLEKKELKGVDDYSNSLMDKGIDLLIVDLLKDFYKSTDKGRENELAIELRLSLKKIATRIDRGFNLEVRMSQPEPVEEDPAESNQAGAQVEYFNKIQGASKNMQFLKLSGDPILSLPENPPEDKPKKK